MREICTLGLMWRGLETGSPWGYRGTLRGNGEKQLGRTYGAWRQSSTRPPSHCQSWHLVGFRRGMGVFPTLSTGGLSFATPRAVSRSSNWSPQPIARANSRVESAWMFAVPFRTDGQAIRKMVVGKIIEPAHTFAKNLKPSLNKLVDSILM